jgi:hypothetical protein
VVREQHTAGAADRVVPAGQEGTDAMNHRTYWIVVHEATRDADRRRAEDRRRRHRRPDGEPLTTPPARSGRPASLAAAGSALRRLVGAEPTQMVVSAETARR